MTRDEQLALLRHSVPEWNAWCKESSETICLPGAKLAGATLAGANLAGANLAGVDLIGADLAGANLVGAYLGETDLAGANLAGTNLASTVLDPEQIPNKGRAEDRWETLQDGRLIGYRTREQPHMRGSPYMDGGEYVAPIFSVCPVTDCHPGIHVYRTRDKVAVEFPDAEIIRVAFRREDLHSAPTKHRVRKMMVLGAV